MQSGFNKFCLSRCHFSLLCWKTYGGNTVSGCVSMKKTLGVEAQYVLWITSFTTLLASKEHLHHFKIQSQLLKNNQRMRNKSMKYFISRRGERKALLLVQCNQQLPTSKSTVYSGIHAYICMCTNCSLQIAHLTICNT